jgi:uncharacterized protein YciI
MQFLAIARDYPDALERRMAVREEHIARGNEMRDRGELLFAVAILDEDSKMIGSLCVLDMASRHNVDEWLKSEPYVTGNVWENIEVLPCRVGPSFASKIE